MGKLIFIVRGGFSISCLGGLLSVDEGGFIHFFKKEALNPPASKEF